MTQMTEKETRVWTYVLANRAATISQISEATDTDVDFVKGLLDRIASLPDVWKNPEQYTLPLVEEATKDRPTYFSVWDDGTMRAYVDGRVVAVKNLERREALQLIKSLTTYLLG